MRTQTPDAETVRRLQDGTAAMIRTIDQLTEAQLRGPSVLPGWSRAHVVAHLALNAEGLKGVLDGLAHDRAVPMYASNERRDADIDELSASDPSTLRARLLGGCTAFRDAVAVMPDAAWARQVERTPGGGEFPADEILAMRTREVEIHHADLDAGRGCADWPGEFVSDLLESTTADRADDGPFTVRAVDLGREWYVGGPGGATVSGTGADLGWWLTGRGGGAGLSVEAGALPVLGPWRRPAPR